jgi:hypothetical protein
MLKLFAVMLGGRAMGCNIELHDVVFVSGASIKETYPTLVKKWFGIKKQLHIDSIIELEYVDGHHITLSKTKPENAKKLYFANFGAYKSGYFGEIHETGFYVATSKSEALSRAKKDLCLSLLEPHCDDNISVDDIILIDAGLNDYYIHVTETNQSAELKIENIYLRLDLQETVA